MKRQRSEAKSSVRQILSTLCNRAAAILLLSPALHCGATDLVTEAVDVAQLGALPRNPAWATGANDIGEVADELPLSHLTLMLRRSADRQRAFEQLLDQQQDPTSANYHRWLTPQEIGEQFGASAHDIEALTQWLRSRGLQIDDIANSRMRIEFSGPAASIGAAFASRLHYYIVDGEKRIAPAGIPQIPAALSGVVQSVHGLSTIRAIPTYRLGTVQFMSQPAPAENPAATVCMGAVCNYYIFPADFAKIYDINPAYQQGINGSGQTIAIIGRARVYLQDIEVFQSHSNLPVKDPIIIVPPGGIDPGTALGSGGTAPPDQVEATVDVTRATSVAPGATIDLVVSGDSATVDGVALASQYVVDTAPVVAHVMNLSWSLCEMQAGSAGVDFYDSLFSQAAAEGISVIVSSGDSGAAGCDNSFAAPPASQTASTNYICASSYATCVGGTEFADSADPGMYWGPPGSAPGYESALSYIPEGAWNEPVDDKGNPQPVATGGGVSMFIPTPAWQTGPGVPGKQGRYTPDVAFSASGHDGYYGCVAAQGGSCVPNSAGLSHFVVFSGTSASAPDMAGIAALLNQNMGGAAQGNLNPRLYALAATPGDSVFHDVTVGTSGVAGCDVSIPSMCNNSTPGPTGLSGGLAGYLVGPGYDEATGLGSIDVANLLAQWNPNIALGVNLDQHGVTGSWYDPATGGQGFEIEVYPDLNGPGQGLLFSGWFTYDATVAGGRRWYALSGNVSKTNPTATLQIFALEGGNLDAAPIVTSGSPIGQATIRFSDCVTGSLTYSFTDGSGRSGSIPLSRLTPNVTCSASGDNGAPPSDYLLSGNWFDPNTSGQGFIFDISPGIGNLFAAWYTFAANGQQLGGPASQDWYTLQSNRFVDGGTSLQNIPIFETSGGVFDNPAPTTSVQVGNASVTFQDCDAMTLTYAFTAGINQGKDGVISLVRVGPTPAGCAL